ncbi:hypothetical protein ACP4OV_027693 [Aristida adscensionis]
MKSNPIRTVFFAVALGFFIGVSFPVQITPNVFRRSIIGGASSNLGCSDIVFRLWPAFRNSTSTVEHTPILQPNPTSEKIAPPPMPIAAERLPPKIIVGESDLHPRRLWGNPRDVPPSDPHIVPFILDLNHTELRSLPLQSDSMDTRTRNYLLVLTIGYKEKVNVNATVHKFSDNFDVLLFHYDGRTTEWDAEFEWSKKAIHVSARGQTKWWFAKRFMHPSIVAPYEYIFLWDEDLGVEAFDAEEYIKIVRKHKVDISQPGLDTTKGPRPFFPITIRRNGSELHKSTTRGNCVHKRPCSGFVEIMAPVFSREAWACVWHMIQNDLVHGHGLDWNFWRCVDVAEEQIAVVDAQYVVHHAVVSLGSPGNGTGTGGEEGSRSQVLARQKSEFRTFGARLRDAVRAQEAALR